MRWVDKHLRLHFYMVQHDDTYKGEFINTDGSDDKEKRTSVPEEDLKHLTFKRGSIYY